MAEWLVGKTSELKDGDRKVVTAGKREIGVFHKDGAYYAYSNTCLHQGGPACEGVMIANVRHHRRGPRLPGPEVRRRDAFRLSLARLGI